jgi:hypothetical protein
MCWPTSVILAFGKVRQEDGGQPGLCSTTLSRRKEDGEDERKEGRKERGKEGRKKKEVWVSIIWLQRILQLDWGSG